MQEAEKHENWTRFDRCHRHCLLLIVLVIGPGPAFVRDGSIIQAVVNYYT